MNNKSLNPVALILLAVLVIGGGAFVFTRTLSNKASQSPMPESIVVNPSGTPSGTLIPSPEADSVPGEEKVITVQAGSFYFNPSEIKVKKGDKVKIILEAKDMMHDFVIEEFNVKMPITKSGDTNEVTFVADEVGKFEYYCSVGNHRQMGQKGTLIVE
jgi:cytochrome c oxidase subunit II